MKKLISLLLAFVMVLSLATVAFAAELDETKTNGESNSTGTITINGVGANTTYKIYKLLHLDSYDTDKKTYNYFVSEKWVAFFDTTEAKQYFTKTDNGYVTWTAATDDDTVAAFAKLALAYAKEHDITPVRSSENDGEFIITGTSGKFSNLTLGYYLVDSTMGALCGLTTTNPNASIQAKNGTPTVDKQVKEDSTNNWGSSNTADIGQIVDFRTTITVHAGAENYVLHDKMSSGLTFQNVSEIRHVVPGTTDETGTLVTSDYYTIVSDGLTDGCTFEIKFTQAFCDHLNTNDKVIVYYSAMVNRNAVIAGDGNSNEAWLDYGEGNHTTHDSTQTYTFGIDIIKTDSQNTLIDGAEFKIYDAETGGNEVAVVLMDDGVTYRRAREDETGVSIIVKDGKVRVVGFDNGTYYLEETKAPENYEKLTKRAKFIIADANLDSVFNDEIYSVGSGVHVVNKSGTMLPETGAAGTAMFIAFGMFVMLTTGVLLVTKKRMSMIEE